MTQSQAELDSKKYMGVMLYVTVHDRRMTELRWFDEELQHEYRALSDIDFYYFSGLDHFEYKGITYLLAMCVGNDVGESAQGFDLRAAGYGTAKAIHDTVVPLAKSGRTRSQYFLPQNEARPPAKALAALDALHAYYDTNHAQMIADYERREQESAAHEAWLRTHPPVRPDTVINYWPVKSRVYLKDTKR